MLPKCNIPDIPEDWGVMSYWQGREASPQPEVNGLVLVANDHEWTARSVETILVAAGYDVVRTFTGTETLRVARERRPDVFILDHQLPDISGLDVCRAVREDPMFGASAPVILTTAGPSGRTQRLAAHEAGAWEFYGQPLDGEALLHKVRVYLAARREVLRLARSGLLDDETGLYNREGLTRRAEELAADARRRGQSISCVAVASTAPGDLDHQISVDILAAINATARASDAKGCLGPGSFAVVGATDSVGARRLADRLRNALGSRAASLRLVIASSDAPALLAAGAEALLDHAATELAA